MSSLHREQNPSSLDCGASCEAVGSISGAASSKTPRFTDPPICTRLQPHRCSSDADAKLAGNVLDLVSCPSEGRKTEYRLIIARLKTVACGGQNSSSTITDEHCCLKLPTSSTHVGQNMVPNATNQPCTPEAHVQCCKPERGSAAGPQIHNIVRSVAEG